MYIFLWENHTSCFAGLQSSYYRGWLAWGPHSISSTGQCAFFITQWPTPHLEGGCRISILAPSLFIIIVIGPVTTLSTQQHNTVHTLFHILNSMIFDDHFHYIFHALYFLVLHIGRNLILQNLIVYKKYRRGLISHDFLACKTKSWIRWWSTFQEPIYTSSQIHRSRTCFNENMFQCSPGDKQFYPKISNVLKWKERQNAHSNGPWDLVEHTHRFWE